MDALNFRNPLAQTPDGQEILLFSRYWMIELAKMQQLITGIQSAVNVLVQSVSPLVGGSNDAEVSRVLASIAAMTVQSEATFSGFSAFSSGLSASIEDGPGMLPEVPESFLPSFIPQPAASLVSYPAVAFRWAEFLETDTWVRRYSNDLGVWTKELFPALIQLLGTNDTFPAFKRSGIIIQFRLADDSDYTDGEVKGRAYDATTWNGSKQITQEDSIRDKFEQLAPGLTGAIVDDSAYGAGWNGDATHAPSRNAAYDKIETLLSKNGVNFGPGIVTSITVVDGQITAIS